MPEISRKAANALILPANGDFMRLSINLLCVTDFVDDSYLPVLELAKRAGFDGVEIPVLKGGPEHYEKLGKMLDRLDLPRTTTSIVASQDANPVSADASSRANGRKHLDWILDCGLALGAESIGGPFHAPIGQFTGAGPTEDELRWGADAHRAMAEQAASQGIILSLEPLNRFETYFLNTSAQAKAYAERVNHPAFRIMYDTFHANIEEKSQPGAIASLAGQFGVFHVSENDRGVPGTGQIDFAGIFRALRATGFDDWLCVEAFGSGLPEIAAATRVWRPLFPDNETLFLESAKFVRSQWAEAGADAS
jgi:D-psicose/D-tagatose/L-ribulose 3-epimerase